MTDDYAEVEDLIRAGLGLDIGSPAFRPSPGVARWPIVRSPRSRVTLTWHPDRVPGTVARTVADVAQTLLAETLKDANPEFWQHVRDHPDVYPGLAHR